MSDIFSHWRPQDHSEQENRTMGWTRTTTYCHLPAMMWRYDKRKDKAYRIHHRHKKPHR